MLHFVCLSLFLLFQANYGLVDEKLLFQKLLDDGVPDDESHDDKTVDYSCVTREMEGIKRNKCPPRTSPPTPTKPDWNKICGDMLSDLKCITDRLQILCPEEVHEYMRKEYKPRVYACYHCKEYVDYLQNQFNVTVQQVDKNNITLEGLTCRFNETAGETCVTKLATPFIDWKCSKWLINPEIDPWTAKCDKLQCIGDNIGAICGINKTKEYWLENPPKVYACFYCKSFVNYMRNEIGLNVTLINDNGTTVDGLTCPVDRNDSSCTDDLAINYFVEECGRKFKSNQGLNKENCDTMNKFVPCVGKHIDMICGNASEYMYWLSATTPPPHVYACWYCNDMVEYLNKIGVRVNRTDENRNFIGSFCPTDEDREKCTAKDVISQCIDDDRSSAKRTGIAYAEYMCGRWLKRVTCIYEAFEAVCGNKSAVKYIESNDTIAPIDLEFCPYCNKLIDYMEKVGAKLRRTGGKGYCEKSDCEISTLNEQIKNKCTYKNTTIDPKELCSGMYRAILCAQETVVTRCGSIFGVDYMTRNYTWPKVYPCWYCQNVTYNMSKFNKTAQQIDSNGTLIGTTCPLTFTSDCAEEHAEPLIQKCKNLQIQSNFTLDAILAVSQNVCSAMLDSVQCIHREVDVVCGEAVANETIKNMRLTVSDRNCPYCNEAINFTQKYGGRLYKESNTSSDEHCISPNCTTSELSQQVVQRCNKPKSQIAHTEFCRQMLEYATCAYNHAKGVCFEQTARDFMRNGINITVYPCAHCKEVIEYMITYNGEVYQADKNDKPLVMRSVNMTCPVGLNELFECPKYNARTFVHQCKETFYEATLHGYANDKVGIEYCSALLVSLECIYDEVKAVCGSLNAKRYMNTEVYPEAREKTCKDCKAAIEFMKKFDAHVYIRDLPGSAVCKLTSDEEKKPISSAKFNYSSSFCAYSILFALFVHTIMM